MQCSGNVKKRFRSFATYASFVSGNNTYLILSFEENWETKCKQWHEIIRHYTQ